jgi:transcriptional regulator with XRE-family HTH domain
MATEPRVGPIGQQVAENVKGFRTRAGMSVRNLSAKLKELGRPILPSGITKIEHGERRVDVDDLVALADALEVTPTWLLMHGELSGEKLREYEQEGSRTIITDAVFNAVLKERVDPRWVQYQLELAMQILPALVKQLEEHRLVKKEGGDGGEHQEED